MIEKTAEIGMVGVGLMGHGIATNILKHDYRLTFLDHPGNQPAGDLLRAGARHVPDLAALASIAHVIILCVTGTPEVEAVLRGAEGLIAHVRPGTVIIDCSTAIPSSTVKIAAEVAGAGGRFLDAPMTRTPKEAAQGRLNLIVGGEKALFEECRPLLESFAENITYAGPAGSGHRMKLIHNFVSLGFAAVLAEAAASAERAEIEPKILLEILAAGGGGGVALARMAPYIHSRDDSGLRFSLANALKDMTYYTTMAGEAEAFRSVATAVRDLYAFGKEAAPGATVPRLIRVLEEESVPSSKK